jgi:hypothetical protein
MLSHVHTFTDCDGQRLQLQRLTTSAPTRYLMSVGRQEGFTKCISLDRDDLAALGLRLLAEVIE